MSLPLYHPLHFLCYISSSALFVSPTCNCLCSHSYHLNIRTFLFHSANWYSCFQSLFSATKTDRRNRSGKEPRSLDFEKFLIFLFCSLYFKQESVCFLKSFFFMWKRVKVWGKEIKHLFLLLSRYINIDSTGSYIFRTWERTGQLMVPLVRVPSMK